MQLKLLHLWDEELENLIEGLPASSFTSSMALDCNCRIMILHLHCQEVSLPPSLHGP